MLFVLPILSMPMILWMDDLRENWRARGSQAIGALAGVVLLYSMYLQYQVNRSDFFLLYDVMLPVADHAADVDVARYCLQRHAGVVDDALLRHLDDLEDFYPVHQLEAIGTAREFVLFYEDHLRSNGRFVNFYWYTGPKPGGPGS
jgi:hypothetical protein